MEVWNTGKCVIDLWPTSNLNLFCILCTQILDMYVNKIDEHKVLKAVPYHCALQIYPYFFILASVKIDRMLGLFFFPHSRTTFLFHTLSLCHKAHIWATWHVVISHSSPIALCLLHKELSSGTLWEWGIPLALAALLVCSCHHPQPSLPQAKLVLVLSCLRSVVTSCECSAPPGMSWGCL